MMNKMMKTTSGQELQYSRRHNMFYFFCFLCGSPAQSDPVCMLVVGALGPSPPQKTEDECVVPVIRTNPQKWRRTYVRGLWTRTWIGKVSEGRETTDY